MILTVSRSDVTGAINYGLSPYLNFPPSLTPPTWYVLPPSTVPQTLLRMTALLSPHGIHHSLIQILASLSLFVQTLNLTRSNPGILLSPEAFSNDLYTLEHCLLSLPSTLLSPAHELALSVALRFSALICLKAVLQEFSHSVNGSKILVERVRESLGCVWMGDECEEKGGFLAWMCVLCAAAANGEVREWFVERLGTLQVQYAACDELGMDRLLNLNAIFNKECIENIWQEARTPQR